MSITENATAGQDAPLPWFAVFSGRECCGHVLNRGRQGFEAFDCDDRSVGLFPTRSAAIAALSHNIGEER
jgi:hypothetical protein